MEDFERLLDARKTLNKSQKEVADSIGISQSYYSEMETGSKEITAKLLLLVYQKFKVNPNFILLGEGDKILKNKSLNLADNFVNDSEVQASYQKPLEKMTGDELITVVKERKKAYEEAKAVLDKRLG